ncbi:hypothetical protein [Candidatus Spongiihabitans sp.]|uniref:hypothetical protein n=1 Tax=Candidatus Spongiihabitans sp. TaxID=3101308 RepID=UPI003C6EFDE4
MSAQQILTAGGDSPTCLRPAATVMRLARMGSFHQSRLSFMRVLLRHLKHHGWRFDRPVWRIDTHGVGVATYRASGPERCYTLVAFAHDLPDELRSDRVIAEAWDATFALHDGHPDESDIERLARNVPYQEAGRISDAELVLSRANRSVRLFDYVAGCLAAGEQPDLERIEPVGYLMRTTAVYGSGKFGAADRDLWAERSEFAGSFQPELLSVWLIRAFTIDMVEHMASVRAPDTAVTLAPEIRRRIGVGNSTGLGMAPFLINHPALIHSWIAARETALARVRAVKTAGHTEIDRFEQLVERSAVNAADWHVEHDYQAKKVDSLRADLATIHAYIRRTDMSVDYAWNRLYEWGEATLGFEGQEQLVSLILEPYPHLVDDLAITMATDEVSGFRIDGSMSVANLRDILEQTYDWTDAVDFGSREAQARVWYVSEEKLEPRLGERFEEPIADYELPLAPGRDARLALQTLADFEDEDAIAGFLLAYPEHRHITRRAQLIVNCPYGEIRDNTIAADMLPIDLLRCKLSFFGATKFDPRSDRWLRITMFQGAPFPDELAELDPDELVYPPLPSGA